MFNQILSTSTIRNIRETVRRTCILILGLKGLFTGNAYPSKPKIHYNVNHPCLLLVSKVVKSSFKVLTICTKKNE